MLGYAQSRARAIIPLAVLLLIVASSVVVWSAEQRVRPVTELALYDARGQLIGNVIDLNGPTQVNVVVKVGQRLVGLEATRMTLREGLGTLGGTLLYASADCTGQPFEGHGDGLPGSFDGSFLAPVVINGTKLYEISGPLQTVQVNSTLHDTGICELNTPGFAFDGYPVAEIAQLRFEPPFELRGVSRDD